MKIRLSRSVLSVLAIAALAGCGKEPEVGHYREPRPNPEKPAEQPAARPAEVNGEAVPTRYLNAIAPQGERSWFFKLSGSPEDMAKAEPAFRKFLGSLKFAKAEGEPPTWDLPEGWKNGPPRKTMMGSVMTVLVPRGDATSELTVSLFGGDVKANIDRWRGELGLPALGAVGDAEYQKTVREETVDGLKVYEVDMQGNKKPGGGMMPPMMKK